MLPILKKLTGIDAAQQRLDAARDALALDHAALLCDREDAALELDRLARDRAALREREIAIERFRREVEADKAEFEANREISRAQYREAIAALKASEKAVFEREGMCQRKEEVIRWNLNPQAHEALRLLHETNENLLITGSAGTGKTTLLNQWRRESPPPTIVLAFTGIAALQARGQTIHSFFNFPLGLLDGKELSPPDGDKLRYLRTLVIDEVSMVRADIMRAVERQLRVHGPMPGKPFGGVRMVLVGDMFQLPPVVDEGLNDYFSPNTPRIGYLSELWFEGVPAIEWTIIELLKSYRQGTEEAAFVELLKRIRLGTQTEKDLAEINKRHLPAPSESTIWLTTTRAATAERNRAMLKRIEKPQYCYPATIIRNSQPISSQDNAKNEDKYPAPVILTLKVGARVMFVKNDSAKRWVNGQTGTVVDAGEPICVEMDISPHPRYKVEKETWEKVRYHYDKKTNKWQEIVVYKFTQYPLELAWARTVHKSQGQSLDAAHIHLDGGAFASGQAYVALSRLRSLNGVTLEHEMTAGDIKTHPRVKEWNENHIIIAPLAVKSFPLTEQSTPIEELRAWSRSRLWFGSTDTDGRV
jgi:hypothetical protein